MNTSGSVLLDTTIVVEHLRSKSHSIAERFKEATALYLPLTALGELLYGAYCSGFEFQGLGANRKLSEDLRHSRTRRAPGTLLRTRQSRLGATREADSAKRYLDRRSSAGTQSAAGHSGSTFFARSWLDDSGMVGRLKPPTHCLATSRPPHFALKTNPG